MVLNPDMESISDMTQHHLVNKHTGVEGFSGPSSTLEQKNPIPSLQPASCLLSQQQKNHTSPPYPSPCLLTQKGQGLNGTPTSQSETLPNSKKKQPRGSSVIEVDIDTTYPNDAWLDKYKHKFKKACSLDLKCLVSGEIPQGNVLRFVCLSDTHGRVERSEFLEEVPFGDVLLHAGDFTMFGQAKEFEDFNEFLGCLPHKVKLVIPGNHELPLDPRGQNTDFRKIRKDLGLPRTPRSASAEREARESLMQLFTEGKLLIDELVEICGIKIYGLPWLPEYGLPGFGLPRGSPLLHMYDRCPAGVDILLSHGPVLGFGDVTLRRMHVGCVELLNSVTRRIKPKYVVFGHIHEGHGAYTDGEIKYINCAVVTKSYKVTQAPIVFDLPIPPPYTREDFDLLTMQDLEVTKPWMDQGTPSRTSVTHL